MHTCKNNTVGNTYHLEQWVDNFFPYSQQQLGFDQPVTIIFQSDEDNAGRMLGKTAYYDPANLEVVLYTDGRHPKDVMRSLSHELVHHAQNCRGDFTQDSETYAGYAQEDPHLRKMEREAYTKGNLIFRDFEDLIKTGKINIEIDFSKSGEPKMSLKEWKNDEIHTRLMKKWGLLKEGKVPRGDAGHGGSGDDHYQFDKKEREAELQEDSGEEEKRHDRRNVDADEKHLRALEKDIDYDKDHERLEEVSDEDLEEGVFGGGREKKWDRIAKGLDPSSDPAPHGDEEKAAAQAYKDAPRGQSRSRRPRRRASDVAGRLAGSWKTIKEDDAANQKISVREAKEITRRIIERIRQEKK